MDPTETELTAITDLAGVFTWGVTGFLEQSLRKALGDPARGLALVPRPAWDTMASALGPWVGGRQGKPWAPPCPHLGGAGPD